MDYFWLKKKAFLGAKVSGYIFLSGILVTYNPNYALSCEYVDYDNTISFSLNELKILSRLVGEINEGVLLYISTIEPENVILNDNYDFNLASDCNNVENVSLEPITYLNYKYDLNAVINELNSIYFLLEKTDLKDRLSFEMGEGLDEIAIQNPENLTITYFYPNFINIVNIDTQESAYISLSDVTIKDKINFYCSSDSLTIFRFNLSDTTFFEKIDISIDSFSFDELVSVIGEFVEFSEKINFDIGNFSSSTIEDVGTNSFEISDKYSFETTLSLQFNEPVYLENLRVTYVYQQKIEILDIEELGIENLGLLETSFKDSLSFNSDVNYFITLRFGVSPIYLKNDVILSPITTSFLGVSSIEPEIADVDVNQDISISIDLDSVRLPLNNLQVTFSDNIINYVNIILNEHSTAFSLSSLEIKDNISLLLDFSSIGLTSFVLNNIDYNKNYSSSIGAIDIEEVRLFHDLLGLKFSDLDGLEFIDLMFN